MFFLKSELKVEKNIIFFPEKPEPAASGRRLRQRRVPYRGTRQRLRLGKPPARPGAAEEERSAEVTRRSGRGLVLNLDLAGGGGEEGEEEVVLQEGETSPPVMVPSGEYKLVLLGFCTYFFFLRHPSKMCCYLRC